MEKMTKNPMAELAALLGQDKQLLQKQLQEVRERFPLVILAYRTQQAVIAELLGPRLVTAADSGSLLAALGDTQIAVSSDLLNKLKADQQWRLSALKICLQSSASAGSSSGEAYLAGLDCFDDYLNGDGNEVVDG